MAYIAKTAFETRVTNNEFYNLCNVTGKYQASSADADCSAGLLCVRNGHLPCEGFTGLYNENAWYMNAATDEATADDVIYACNTSIYSIRTMHMYVNETGQNILCRNDSSTIKIG